jgi:hypothetical protein
MNLPLYSRSVRALTARYWSTSEKPLRSVLGARGECDGAPIREDIRSSSTQPSSSDLQDASTKIPNAGEGFK